MPESNNTSGMKRSSSAVRRFVARLFRFALVLFVALLVFLGLLYLGFALLLHAAHESLQSHPDPAPDYAEAVTRFQGLQKIGGTGNQPSLPFDFVDARVPHRKGGGFFPRLYKLPSTVPRTWPTYSTIWGITF